MEIKIDHILQVLSNLLALILGLIFVIAMAFKKISIPATSIEMSLQSLSISLLVIALGKRASWVIFIYLIMATFGLPILAEGASNPKWFFAPSAGYYFGFLISSTLLPRILFSTKPKTFFHAWLTFSLNESSILFCGFLVLSFYVGPIKALLVGIWPFLFGAFLKISIAAFIYILKFSLNNKISCTT